MNDIRKALEDMRAGYEYGDGDRTASNSWISMQEVADHIKSILATHPPEPSEDPAGLREKLLIARFRFVEWHDEAFDKRNDPSNGKWHSGRAIAYEAAIRELDAVLSAALSAVLADAEYEAVVQHEADLGDAKVRHAEAEGLREAIRSRIRLYDSQVDADCIGTGYDVTDIITMTELENLVGYEPALSRSPVPEPAAEGAGPVRALENVAAELEAMAEMVEEGRASEVRPRFILPALRKAISALASPAAEGGRVAEALGIACDWLESLSVVDEEGRPVAPALRAALHHETPNDHDPGDCDDPRCEEPECIADRKMRDADRRYDEKRDLEMEKDVEERR